MTLLEMRKKILKLIEEYESTAGNTKFTKDVDIFAKIDDCINIIQNELSRIKKIPVYEEIDVKENEIIELNDELDNFFQLKNISNVTFKQVNENTIKFLEDGIAEISYYKYPKQITESTNDSYKFELSIDVLEIMPLGVAGLVLSSDVSQGYGNIYTQKYETMLNRLDVRYIMGTITIEDGGLPDGF